MAWDIPLTEFDADSAVMIDPEPGSTSGEIPEHAVICFFGDVIDEVCGGGRAEVVATFRWEHGTDRTCTASCCSGRRALTWRRGRGRIAHRFKSFGSTPVKKRAHLLCLDLVRRPGV